MVNYNFQAGKLIKDAIREVNGKHPIPILAV